MNKSQIFKALSLSVLIGQLVGFNNYSYSQTNFQSQSQIDSTSNLETHKVFFAYSILVQNSRVYQVQQDKLVQLRDEYGNYIQVNDSSEIRYSSDRMIVINNIPYVINNDGRLYQLEESSTRNRIQFRDSKVVFLSDQLLLINGQLFVVQETKLIPLKTERNDVLVNLSQEQVSEVNEKFIILNNKIYVVFGDRLIQVNSPTKYEKLSVKDKKVDVVSESLILIDDKPFVIREDQAEPLKDKDGNVLQTLKLSNIQHKSKSLLVLNHRPYAIVGNQLIQLKYQGNYITLDQRKILFVTHDVFILNGRFYQVKNSEIIAVKNVDGIITQYTQGKIIQLSDDVFLLNERMYRVSDGILISIIYQNGMNQVQLAKENLKKIKNELRFNTVKQAQSGNVISCQRLFM